MPGHLPSQCSYPGCAKVAYDGTGRCTNHPRKPFATRAKVAVKRLSGAALRRARESLFSGEPLCRWCALEGRVTLATQRDHIIPLTQGGMEVESNVQPLCAACHALKSEAERKWGLSEEAMRKPKQAEPELPRDDWSIA